MLGKVENTKTAKFVGEVKLEVHCIGVESVSSCVWLP